MRHLVPLGVGVCLACLGSVLWFRLGPPTPIAMAADIAPQPALANVRQCEDKDADGFGRGCAKGADCNDFDPQVNPGQRELCNFRDDDCNGEVDDGLVCGAVQTAESRVKVAAGEFVMGSAPGDGADDEHPRHRVWLSAFEIDQFEVTNRRYRACVKANACVVPKLRSSNLRTDYFDNDRFADYPVIFVAAPEAEAFCRFAGGRLPSEAEWEKAARGPSPSLNRFPWGDREPDCSLANLGGTASCLGDTDHVGRRPLGQSPYGAMDMAGNVWEWVADWYAADYYRDAPLRDPKGPDSGSLRVIRGGCWESGSDSLRVSCRKPVVAGTWAYNVGFRCAYGKEN
jgi:formylglycine-generating enzyme required for sulfatase activity